MLQAAVLALVLLNVACRERVLFCEVLECNHWAQGSVQLIAWRKIPGMAVDYPQDWTISPSGHRSGEFWFDGNGTVIRPGEFRESWTERDVERQAYQWHRERGVTEPQEGFWHEAQATNP